MNWQLYLFILIPFLYIVIFHYIPIYGLQIAFKKYNIIAGIHGSEWVGLDNFKRFFNSYDFRIVLSNTIGIAFYQLLVGFTAPIFLALSLNYIKQIRFKKTMQMLTYAPHFISVVVMSGIAVQLLSSNSGIIYQIIEKLNGEPVEILTNPSYFKSIYVWSGVWQNIGWGSIIYLATLSSIDPTLHEAAVMDGANKIQRIKHIDIPGIVPTIIILFILEVGKFLNVGFQKVLLLQNPFNLQSSEVIDTYVYKIGIITGLPDYSYATSIGMFKSIIGLILVLGVNQIARKVNNNGLW